VDLLILSGLIVGAGTGSRGISLRKLHEKTVQKGLAIGLVSLLWGLAIYFPSLFVYLGLPRSGIIAAQSLRTALLAWSSNEFLSQYSTFVGILGAFTAWVGSRYLKRYFDVIFWIFIALSVLIILGSLGSLPPFW